MKPMIDELLEERSNLTLTFAIVTCEVWCN
jgi:hypothetical protein